MPGIFISYRRNEASGHAGRLFDRLGARFGDDRVFMDVDTLVPSEHFATRIERAIATADVMLVLIGPRWIAEIARLADPADFVRREIATALRVECRVVPVCLDGASIPDASTLPEDLRKFVACEGAVLRHGEFGRDADHLADSLTAFVRPSPTAIRRCLSQALVRAGWPFSWAAPVIRRVSPRAALAGLAFAGALTLGSALVLTGWAAYGNGYDAGSAAATEDALVTGSRLVADRAFILRGRVKDSANRDLEDATVTLKNQKTGHSTQALTTSDGSFQVDLRAIDVQRDTMIDLLVEKKTYRRQSDTFSYLEGFAYRSVLQPEAGGGGGR